MAHVWEKSYPSGVRWDTPLPPAVPLDSLLETAATRWPDRIAIDFYDRTFTYRELHDLAARAAKGLQTLGVGPGVHVGSHLPNTPHFVICFFAVLMAGGRVVNFSPLAAPRELKYQLTDADTQVMITLGLPLLYPQIAALKGTAKFQTLVVCNIDDFLPAPIARAFGPVADRVGAAGSEIDGELQRGSAAARLMRTFATQVEVLRRLRTGGQQFVRVEHVYVNDGGQAVIGNVKKQDVQD